MRIRALKFMLAAAVPAILFLPAAHAQPPETVLIQGQLLDELGQPLTGIRGYRVRFFDAEVDGAQLGGDIVGQTVLSPGGLFAIPLEPSALVLEAPAAWYELAVDSSADASGLTEADTFPQRIRVHSVPFSRVAGQALSIEVEAIGGGAVSAAEFESLAGITGSVQSQLDSKADAATVDDALALKADTAVVDDALALKADVAALEAVEDTLAEKPDLAEVLPRKGESFVVVETTDDPVQNGANLLAAYAEAAALTPHGQSLSANNRAVVILPPGKYDLGSGQLELNTEFVDIEGASSDRDKQHIVSTSEGANTGVLRQTANDVRIENLLVECTRASGGLILDATGPAAYFPDDDLPNTVIRNCRFLSNQAFSWSMRNPIIASGTYEDVVAGIRSFGGPNGTASGTFINCTGSTSAFGSGPVSTASGTFINCVGGGNAFGGLGGTASGTFINCTGGTNSFGGGAGGTASGTFTNCTGGISAFGGGSGSIASGTFTNCLGGSSAFGGTGTASGIFTNCTGGLFAFGGGLGGSAPGGKFYYCVGALNSLGTDGDPAPEHFYCVRDGAAIP